MTVPVSPNYSTSGPCIPPPDSLLVVPNWVHLGSGILVSVVCLVHVVALRTPRLFPLPSVHLCASSSSAFNLLPRQKECSASAHRGAQSSRRRALARPLRRTYRPVQGGYSFFFLIHIFSLPSVTEVMSCKASIC